MSKYALEDTTKYLRDGHSKAIISNDLEGLKQYRAKRESQKSILNRMREIETDINTVKQEMIDIKLMLQQIIKNQGK
jgi:hypothetical protein